MSRVELLVLLGLIAVLATVVLIVPGAMLGKK